MHRLADLLPIFLLFSAAQALHFYLDANEKRCFIEEVPTDTVVHGTQRIYVDTRLETDKRCKWTVGTYKALEWSEEQQKYQLNHELGINVQVEVRLRLLL
jgi:p24 family protein alpha